MAASTVYTDAYYGAMPDLERPGVVLCRSAQYVASAELEANSVVNMLKIPAGAKLLALEWKSSALGAGRTIDIGISTDLDRYVDGADVSAAANGRVNCINEDIAAAVAIQIKVLGAALPKDAQFDINVWYKMADAIADEE